MKLVVSTECGETTCKGPAKFFCRFYATRRLGSIDYCSLFHVDLYDAPDGKLKRCEKCLDEFGKKQE